MEAGRQGSGSGEVARPASALPALVAFDHPFFGALPNAYFRVSPHTRQPVFVLDAGGGETALSFQGILREFGIPGDSPDGRMLELVGRALQHVKALRTGDPLPREILTGEASWEIDERHRATARQRLTFQLASWFSGGETVITDPDELQQIADDPATRARIDAAISAAAAQLGIADSDKAQVLTSLETIADELAYIEALRDRYVLVKQVAERMRMARRMIARDKRHGDAADRICRLTNLALSQFNTLFEQVDAQTGEIISTLRNGEAQRRYIRTLRDDLHGRLSAWEELAPGWMDLDPARPLPSPTLLDETYRFLASRFMPAENWVLATRRGATSNTGERKLKTAMTW